MDWHSCGMSPLSSDEVESLVAAQRFASFEFHDQLPSTNDRAKELAREKTTALPCLVIANRQTQGRGRGANRWEAASGSLTFSLIVPWESSRRQHLQVVSLWAAIAACRAVRRYLSAERCGVKWPNDVYCDGRKMGGLLLETVGDQLIVGVGLNVSNPVDQERLPDATSLVAALQGATEGVSVRSLLAAYLEEWQALGEELGKPISADLWREFDLLRDREVTVDTGTEVFVGTARGVGGSGALQVESGDRLITVMSGTVRKIPASNE
jgi:BirA family biotin operon repressor/biotin-[acetyl-CoA-carboxylase] ligase